MSTEHASGCVAAGGTVTTGDVTLELAASTRVKYDAINYDDPADRAFRATTFGASDGVLPALDPSLNLAVYFATAPIDTTFCPPAKMTLPNSECWPPGTPVELFLHGTSTFGHWAAWGGWSKISDGAVSQSGTTISTNDGEGIPVLGVIGIRQTP